MSYTKIISIISNCFLKDKSLLIENLEILSTNTLKYMDSLERRQFSNAFYEVLMAVLENHSEKIINGDANFQDIEILKMCSKCIKDSFFKSPMNQNLFCEAEFICPIENLLTYFVPRDGQPKDLTVLAEKISGSENEAGQTLLLQLLLGVVTLFINAAVGNASTRKLLWPRFRSYIRSLILYPNGEVKHLGSACLHQFLVEKDIKDEIFRDEIERDFFRPVLQAYLMPGVHACFALYSLEILLESSEVILSAWDDLPEEESLLVLDVLSSSLQGKSSINSMPSHVNFFLNKFKSDGDVILKPRKHTVNPNVFTRMSNFLTIAAASDGFRETLQTDKSCLVSAIYLLRWFTDASNSYLAETEPASRETPEQAPFYDLKTILVRLIASLVYRNEANQNIVRDNNGLMLILSNTQRCTDSPFSQEAAILALRNLLEGNAQNQKFVSELRLKGAVRDDALTDLGVEVAPSQDGTLIYKFK